MLPGPGGLRPASVSRALRRLGAPSWLVAAALVALALAGWWLSPRPAGQQETGQGAGVYELSGTVVAVAGPGSPASMAASIHCISWGWTPWSWARKARIQTLAVVL